MADTEFVFYLSLDHQKKYRIDSIKQTNLVMVLKEDSMPKCPQNEGRVQKNDQERNWLYKPLKSGWVAWPKPQDWDYLKCGK